MELFGISLNIFCKEILLTIYPVELILSLWNIVIAFIIQMGTNLTYHPDNQVNRNRLRYSHLHLVLLIIASSTSVH